MYILDVDRYKIKLYKTHDNGNNIKSSFALDLDCVAIHFTLCKNDDYIHISHMYEMYCVSVCVSAYIDYRVDHNYTLYVYRIACHSLDSIMILQYTVSICTHFICFAHFYTYM